MPSQARSVCPARPRHGFTLVETIIVLTVLAVAIPASLWNIRDAAGKRANPVLYNQAHWYAAEKGAIHWTDAGLKKIESLLDVEFSKKKEPSPVTAVTVTKITVNTRVVSAIAPDGSVITVLGIRDNRLLTPKQKIPAALGDDGKWRWHGPQPKRKGRLIS